jgi:pimeloyl-ACP methyl ester carboxylesterase
VRTEIVTSAEGLPLTAYIAGSGPEVLMILNAPGMSMKFWTPAVGVLQAIYTVVGMEYRGFPDSSRELTSDEADFSRIVADVRAVVRHFGLERLHVVSWCLGAKPAWEYYRRFPDEVTSLVSVGMAYAAGGSEPVSPFGVAMQGIRRRLERDPSAMSSMITLMRRVGLVPDAAFLASIFREEDQAALTLMDLLDGESSMSTLAFYLLDSPVGLRNYLALYGGFRSARITDLFPRVAVPVTVVTGSRDQITPMRPDIAEELRAIRDVELVTVENASHFLPVEYPRRLAGLIDAHVRRRSASEATS